MTSRSKTGKIGDTVLIAVNQFNSRCAERTKKVFQKSWKSISTVPLFEFVCIVSKEKFMQHFSLLDDKEYMRFLTPYCDLNFTE